MVYYKDVGLGRLELAFHLKAIQEWVSNAVHVCAHSWPSLTRKAIDFLWALKYSKKKKI